MHMAVPLRVIKSFLKDASLMAQKADRTLQAIVHDRVHGEVVSPERVQEFYRIVHSLKGTASMIEGGKPVVEALHAIEARLACVSLRESATKLGWVHFGQASLAKADLALKALQIKVDGKLSEEELKVLASNGKNLFAVKDSKSAGEATQSMGSPTEGVIAKVAIQGSETLLWFPVHTLFRVLSPQEIRGRRMLNIQGCWVPVIGTGSLGREPKTEVYGLCLTVESGQVVVAIEEFVGLSSWREAMDKGAREGMEALFGAKKSDRKPDQKSGPKRVVKPLPKAA